MKQFLLSAFILTLGFLSLANVASAENIYGGYCDTGNCDVSHNTITPTYTIVGNVYGGYASGPGLNNAVHNTVNIQYGYAVIGNVYGGYASGGHSNNAYFNRINIYGTVSGDVYGGDAPGAGMNDIYFNWIHIYGSVYGSIYAGKSSVTYLYPDSHVSGSISGGGGISNINALNVGRSAIANVADDFGGSTIQIIGNTQVGGNIENFEYIDFLVSADQGEEAALTVGELVLGDGAGNNSKISVSTTGDTDHLEEGQHIHLIEGTVTNNNSLTEEDTEEHHGSSLHVEWEIGTEDSGELIATLTSVETDPQTKAISEGFLGGLALVTQGADLVAEQGISKAVEVTDGGLGAFAALSAGSMRYNTGSHVDMESISMIAGLAFGMERLSLGAFFETGNGNYDTFNSFTNTASIDGDGDAKYIGGGILAHMGFSNFYTEASARIGKIDNEYGSEDFGEAGASYDSSSLYYGLHLGAGYLWNINENASLDLYGKYFWTRLAGDSFNLSTGDPVDFEDADSHRLRLGTRFNYAVNEYASPYLGAAYEHEFDGKAEGTVFGNHEIDAPKLKGGTGIAELGISITPQSLPLYLDLAVQGYIGTREGVAGKLEAKLEF
jgi:hypothetical protein